MEFNPTKRGGGSGRNSLSHDEGGRGVSFEVVLSRELEVLAVLKGSAKCFHL